jgi:hypothetical protein
MASELSYGLPELITRGNRIVRADSLQPVLLRGVNRSGLEYVEPSDAGFLSAAGLNFEEIEHICTGWHCNVLRLPFNQASALYGRNGHSAEEYLSAVDQVISWAASCGTYTILDLQWLDVETVYGCCKDQNGAEVPNRVPPLPNPDTISLWDTLALRYRDEPAVLFDLLNEPHPRLQNDHNPIYVVGPGGEIIESDSHCVGPQEWLAWAVLLVLRVRQLRPAGLILVGGVNWAFDLRGIFIDSPNILYSAHIYPNRKPSTWWKAIGRSNQVPVFIGEWGGTGRDLAFGRRLAREMRSRSLSWTAWSWVDHPHLVQCPRSPDYIPTPFGELVRAEL